ncbi:MAG TPA: glucokinase, partial [Caldimonas sp.]
QVPVVGEGGHVSLSAADAVEEAVVAILRRRFGHVSAERALSGPGLVNLYAASCELAGRPIEPLDPPDVADRARLGNDAGCRQAIDWFFAFLGSLAGDLALTLGARGGIYIAGGIVAQLGDMIASSRFRERFEAKGRYAGYLARIPTAVVLDASALALRGANAALDA